MMKKKYQYDDLMTKILPEHRCQHCQKVFADRTGLYKHINYKTCKVLKKNETTRQLSLETAVSRLIETVNQQGQIIDNFNNLQTQTLEKISQVETKSSIHNYLQIMCVKENDNYLDRLAQDTDLRQALTFIKNCALSRISGDCKLLEKMYLNEKNPSIMYADRTRTKFIYYDENHKRVIENNPTILAKKLADNLQRSYLKGVSHYKIDDAHIDVIQGPTQLGGNSLPDVDSYDLQAWNFHIYELGNEKYQKKLLNQLNIPFERGCPP